MLFAVGYERQIYSHLGCYTSIDDVSIPTWVTGCWLSPLVCTRQDFSIHECHQYCWCMLLLNFSVHVNIFHREHIWRLIDNFHWWKRGMLTYCWEGTNFYQSWILLQNPGWCFLHILCWNFFAAQEHLFVFICGRFHMKDFLWRGMAEHHPRRWDTISFFSGNSHHGLHDASSTFTNCFVLLLHQEACSQIFLV